MLMCLMNYLRCSDFLDFFWFWVFNSTSLTLFPLLLFQPGSLLNLAKHPASTVQILGAEKALFRALKTRRDTPKYGLIYHASLVGQTSAKNKGKISRMLAAKTALSIRYDALGEDTNAEMGVENRAKLEARLRQLEEKGVCGEISEMPTVLRISSDDDDDMSHF